MGINKACWVFQCKENAIKNPRKYTCILQKLPTYNPKLQDCNKKVKRPDESGVYGTRRSRSNEYIMNKTGYPRTVVKYTNVFNPQLHPTQKNVELNEHLIELFTNENETVLDNTMGSGTKGIACINTNRDFIGIELDDNYFAIAEDLIWTAKRKKEYEQNLS